MKTTLKYARSFAKTALFGLTLATQVACSSYDSTSDHLTDGQFSGPDAAFQRQLGAFKLPDSSDFAAIPQDPNNPVTQAKVDLGRLLFHDPTLLANPHSDKGLASGSCATCHHASAGFQAGTQQAIGEGGLGFGAERRPRSDYLDGDLDVQPLRTPSAMNAAWFENVLWNGQFGAVGDNEWTDAAWTDGTPKAFNHLGFHGLEIQAIAGQEVHRLSVDAAGIRSIPRYAELFDAAYPETPRAERVTSVTAGLAIAAFERTLLANEAPFQLWLRGNSRAMTERQVEGARLFFGRAQCVDCHNNPGLGGMAYHALGMADVPAHMPGVDEDAADHLGRGGFTGNPEDDYGFKTPQLYNLRDSAFLGHGGTFRSVRDVIEYKNRGEVQNEACGSEQASARFAPLGLSVEDIDALTDFVENALHDPNLDRYQPTQDEMPNGACVPNEDPQSRLALGCTGEAPALPASLGGQQLVNAEIAGQKWTLPEGLVLAEGGILVIARNASREEFEAHWGALPPGALFVSANAHGYGAPQINGGEQFALLDATGATIDDSCPTMSEGMSLQRATDGSWQSLSADQATPGRVPDGLRGQGLVITEVADTVGVGAYRFEYVELAYVP